MWTDPRTNKTQRYGPPRAWVPPTAPEYLGPAEWNALVEGGLQFAPTTAAGARYRLVYGTCLEPMIVAGDHLIVRSVADNEVLEQNALYVIRWNDEGAVQKYRDKIHLAATEPVVIAKFLRFVGREWWTLANDGISVLNGEAIERVVGLQSRGRPPQAVHTGTIDPNAASQVLSVSGSNWGGTTALASPATFTSATLTLIATGVAVSIDVSGTYNGYSSATGTPSISMWITRDGARLPGSITGYFTTGTLPNSLLINPTPVSIIATDAPPAGVHTYGVTTVVTGATGGSGGFANTFCDMSNYTIKIREYKR